MSAPATKLPIVGQASSADRVHSHLEGEKSRDLIFALVAHAGAGATWVASQLFEQLTSKGYAPQLVKVSDALHGTAERLGVVVAKQGDTRLDVATQRQDEGDHLRAKYGSSIASGLAIKEITRLRDLGADKGEAKPRAFILDSLKHPEEVAALRAVYQGAFYLVSVVCSYEQRLERLQRKFKDAPNARQHIEDFMRRDASGDLDEGQHVRKTLHLADFFVSNPDNGTEQLADHLNRFMDIVMGTSVVRPNRDERGMYAAWGAALRSSCLSRHVGAAVLASTGEVLATGTNDVPRAKGGLYEEGVSPDHRCFQPYKDPEGLERPGFCRNDVEKAQIYNDAWQQLQAAGVIRSGATAVDVRRSLEQTRIRNLVEFSRAVHAEMDALVSMARVGGRSSSGATMYCTTFPCHSCARHIVAAGIAEVIYIEPYPKSLAEKLHSDSVLVSDLPVSDPNGRVVFRLFSGVAPRRFASMFERRREEKDEQGILIADLEGKIALKEPVFRKSFLDLERDIARNVDSLGKEGGTP